MTYEELENFIKTLSPDQKKQTAVVFKGDEEQGYEIEGGLISEEDIYWELHGDWLGPLETAKESLGDDWEINKDDLVIVPKGTVTLHTDIEIHKEE